MSIYYRICPHDGHICADRNCLSPMHDVCMLEAAKPTTAGGTKPANTSEQIKYDEPDHGDIC